MAGTKVQPKVEKIISEVFKCTEKGWYGCRNLGLSEKVSELLDIAGVHKADISEIPVVESNQVVVLYELPNDDNYYELFAGIGNDNKYHFEINIIAKIEVRGNTHHYVDLWKPIKVVDLSDLEMEELPMVSMVASKREYLDENVVLEEFKLSNGEYILHNMLSKSENEFWVFDESVIDKYVRIIREINVESRFWKEFISVSQKRKIILGKEQEFYKNVLLESLDTMSALDAEDEFDV